MGNANSLQALSAVAARQLGLFTRRDAKAAELSDGQIRRLVGRGLVERVTPGVFRFAGSPRSWHQDVLVACLDGGNECVASHRTAAVLHGFDGFRPDVVEVVVPMTVRHRRKNAIVHHTRDLPAADRVRIGSIPVTSRARTLIDLGAVVPPDLVEEAFDGAERDGLVRRDQVGSRYAALRAPGRNGIGAMTQILAGRSAKERIPRSVLERRMRRLLSAAALPMPVGNYRVRLPAGVVYEIDLAYVDLLLGIELDGHGSHATRRARAGDNVRGNALETAGWTLRRFTYEQVMHEPALVTTTVRDAVAAARRRAIDRL